MILNLIKEINDLGWRAVLKTLASILYVTMVSKESSVIVDFLEKGFFSHYI